MKKEDSLLIDILECQLKLSALLHNSKEIVNADFHTSILKAKEALAKAQVSLDK